MPRRKAHVPAPVEFVIAGDSPDTQRCGELLKGYARCMGKGDCRATCPSNAMIFGDLDDPASPIQGKLRESVQLLASKRSHPKVFCVVPENEGGRIEEWIMENPKMQL